jgi:hypothetical protein
MVTKRVCHNGGGPIYDIRFYIYIYYIIHTLLLYVFNNEVATNLNVKHHQLFL